MPIHLEDFPIEQAPNSTKTNFRTSMAINLGSCEFDLKDRYSDGISHDNNVIEEGDDDNDELHGEDTTTNHDDTDLQESSEIEARRHGTKRRIVGQDETTIIAWMRIVLVFVLICSAIGVSVIVHLYLQQEEINDFQTTFASNADKIVHGIASSLDDTLGAMDSYMTQMVAQTTTTTTTTTTQQQQQQQDEENEQEQKNRFPFVTVPQFGIQSAKLLKLSKAYQFATAYFVTPEDRKIWELYANDHIGWINNTIEVQENNDEFYGNSLKADGYMITDSILSADETGLIDAPNDPYPNIMNPPNFLVSWQMAPLVQELHSIPYNFDLWNSIDVRDDIVEATISQRVVIAKSPNVIVDPNNAEQVLYNQELAEINSFYLPPDQDYASEPVSGIGYPIIDTTGTTTKNTIRIDSTIPQKVVGIVWFSMYWRELIRDILPSNSVGLILVIDSSCGESFTYRLDGPTSTYLGGGDLHDETYNHMEYKTSLVDLMDTATSERGSSYTGLPLNTEWCTREFRVYPSIDMENQHRTSNPLLLSIVAASIFLFTSILFFLYDIIVARRQRVVNNVAIASSAIVSNLFPDQVAEQLYQEQAEQQKKDANLKGFLAPTGDNHINTNGVIGNGSHPGGGPTSAPIASEYLETSVLFADLAGFTKWSSNHTPSEVFQMLETLYGAFDEIAKRRRVFKVETIGDCYLAVTGIPDPQDDHAMRMCRFAADCLNAMNNAKVELAQTLGDETEDLEFRVGIHSGSVVAGVLRGDKGRFQLFGDTVNTAARMESNGIPGRIHVSQSTADALISSGKHGWVIPRHDKINAKGLGSLQTYFVDVHGGSKAHSSTDESIMTSFRGDNTTL